jgi:hypothetical protein
VAHAKTPLVGGGDVDPVLLALRVQRLTEGRQLVVVGGAYRINGQVGTERMGVAAGSGKSGAQAAAPGTIGPELQRRYRCGERGSLELRMDSGQREGKDQRDLPRQRAMGRGPRALTCSTV